MHLNKFPYQNDCKFFFKDWSKFKELSSVFGFKFIATHLGISFSTLKEILLIFITFAYPISLSSPASSPSI